MTDKVDLKTQAMEVAQEIDDYLQTIDDRPWGNHEVMYTKAIDIIMRLVKELDSK